MILIHFFFFNISFVSIFFINQPLAATTCPALPGPVTSTPRLHSALFELHRHFEVGGGGAREPEQIDEKVLLYYSGEFVWSKLSKAD